MEGTAMRGSAISKLVLAAGSACALAVVAAPILAQRAPQQNSSRAGNSASSPANNQERGRISRSCRREIVKLCGRDRSEIRSCLQELGDQLSAGCRDDLRLRIQQRQQQQGAPVPFQARIQPTRSVLYGNHQRQRVDVYEPKGAVEELPLVLFIHGGGWQMGNAALVQQKPQHFSAARIYFASAGYRLLPDHPVEEQAKDVGLALQALVAQADLIGFDPSRIVLMGHSAGAHLAALVATDPQYAGSAFDAIRGVVLLDGAGYDIAKNIEDAGFQARRIYETAFGFDEARHRALSPITHVGGPDAPNWLALYVAERGNAGAQAEMMVAALSKAGASAQAISIAGTDHGRMNRDIGQQAGAQQTQAIDAFLKRVFAKGDMEAPEEAEAG